MGYCALVPESFNRITRYLASTAVQTPCLVLDLEGVKHQYLELKNAIPFATCHYAIKSNPAPAVLKTLCDLGSSFDAASIQEVNQCIASGAKPEQILISNTAKKSETIQECHRLGVELFAFDSPAELEKIAKYAPGSKVFCRIMTSGVGAQWPLTRKFGCSEEQAQELLVRARYLGLVPYGVSFHVGSQMLSTDSWDIAVASCARIFDYCAKHHIVLQLVNIGGGFPTQYRQPIPETALIGKVIKEAFDRHFGSFYPKVIMEPGRYMTGDAAILVSEVVLISHNHPDDKRKWVFLDVGKFSGLYEVEEIEYRIVTDKDHNRMVPVVIAGPTCDSADILYEKKIYKLPENLEIGDRVFFLSAGAYTYSTSFSEFNGFPPTPTIVLPLNN